MYDLQAMAQGLQGLLDLNTVLWLIVGFVLGFAVGAIPGFNDVNLMAILLPFSLLLEPKDAIVAMTALYCAAQAAGSIPAILVNIPGTPGTAATPLEGYPMARQGKAGFALGVSFASSALGGLFGAIVAVVLTPVLGAFALRFGPAEMFAVVVFGFSVISSLAGERLYKGLLAVALGFLVSLIGADSIQGYPRATFGIPELYDGLPLIPVLLGLFGFSEMLFLVRERSVAGASATRARGFSEILAGLREALRYPLVLLRSSVIGTVIGIIPGTGATIASFVAYGQAKRWSKQPERFGKGCPEGLVATDSANNACVGGAMIPTLTLGLPGSSSTLMMLAALVLHGVRPGPRFFMEFQKDAYTILFSLIIANFLIFLVGLPIARYFQAVTTVSSKILVPVVTVLLFMGAYAWRFTAFDLLLLIVFGLLGAAMRLYGYPVAAFLVAVVLGPMAESNFLRAFRIGGYGIFFKSWISQVLLLLALVSLVIPMLSQVLKRQGSHARSLAG